MSANLAMSGELHKLLNLSKQSPLGTAALAVALLCGTFYVLVFLAPAFVHNGLSLQWSDNGWSGWLVILGSGLDLLLILISLGIERRCSPALAALCLLAVTENFVFPVMPFWTVLLLVGKSGWAALGYVFSLTIGLVIAGRRILGMAAPGQVR